MGAPLLAVRNLTVAFPVGGGLVPVVERASFDVEAGEIVALVGESGSGKSVTAFALLDLVPEPGRTTEGEILFEGRDVRKLPPAELRKLRGGGIGLVFQEPGSALDPVRTIGDELVGVLRRHRGLTKGEALREASDWLERVSLPDPERRLSDLPYRMSGGMRQRATIALALAGGPRLLVADEPTTALDVTIQAQILALLQRLRRELGLAVLLITHDLGVVAEVADRAVVMYAGEVVEEAGASELFASPLHPYTRALLASRPDATAGRRRLVAIDGTVPEPAERADACLFAPRCPDALPACLGGRPALRAFSHGRRVACIRAGEGRGAA